MIHWFGVPTCAICNKPVEAIACYEALDMSGDQMIVVKCHGETETIRVDAFDLGVMDNNFDPSKIKLDGLAFNRPRSLPGAGPRGLAQPGAENGL